jgi:protein SCO1/2
MNGEARAAERAGSEDDVATSAAAAAAPSRKKRLVITLLLLAAAFGVALFARSMRPKPVLPVMGRVPEFALTNQKGAPFTQANMAGHPWLADFIFTHCSSSCPKLTARMREVDSKLSAKARAEVRFVSFSVDPENDTPAALDAYARENKADETRWSFVTGPTELVQKTVVNGFKMTAQRTGAGEQDILHGNWFVMGDGAGNIRGYYAVENDDEVDVVVTDLTRLVESAR